MDCFYSSLQEKISLQWIVFILVYKKKISPSTAPQKLMSSFRVNPRNTANFPPAKWFSRFCGAYVALFLKINFDSDIEAWRSLVVTKTSYNRFGYHEWILPVGFLVWFQNTRKACYDAVFFRVFYGDHASLYREFGVEAEATNVYPEVCRDSLCSTDVKIRQYQ